MRTMTVPLALLLVASAALAGDALPASAVKTEGGNLDLMAGYWRHHLTFSPARISPEELAKDVAANVDGLADRCRKSGININKPFLGWPFYYEFVYAGHGDSSPITLLIRSAPPPAEWMQPGFDDSNWQRQRLPLTAGYPRPHHFSSEGWAVSHGVGLSCFRQQVLVEDPTKVKRMALRMAYRGGAIVYVNGKEVARGHLPAGRISPDVGGQCYPVRAYVLHTPIEGPAMEFWCGADKRRSPDRFPRTRPSPEFSRSWGLGDDSTGALLPTRSGCPEMITYHSYWNGGNYVLTKAEWEEVVQLRNRMLEPVEIPPGLLTKGVNLIAVEIHRSDLNPVIFEAKRLGDHWDSMGAYAWSHECLLEMGATVDPPGAIALEQRAVGIRVWPDDMHRRYLSPEFGPSGAGTSPVCLVGARNGVYSGQVVMGTDKDVSGVSASVTDLFCAGGGKIPSAAVSVRYAKGISLSQMGAFGVLRGFQDRESGQDVNVTLALQRFAGSREIRDKRANAQTAAEMRCFDPLSAAAPQSIPAGSCQPVWVTVAVPKDAAPGDYTGLLTLKAGTEEIRVPLRLWVMDWTLPDPQQFETVMALEQSPYGVAQQYQVAPWSGQHFKLLAASFKQLARVNGGCLMIPVVLRSEFGNGDDSPVVFVKKTDGSFGCDLTRVEEYLDTATKMGCTPKIVCLVLFNDPFYGVTTDKKPRFLVRDEAADKTEGTSLPPADSPGEKKMLGSFVKGIQELLKKRGLEKAACWGYTWDALPEDFWRMAKLLSELAPDVGWARGCHAHVKGMDRSKGGKDPFTVVASIYDLPQAMQKDKTGRYVVWSNRGWKNPAMRLVFPRVLSSVVAVYTDSVPFYYRIAPERAMLAGVRGVGRIGADYWAGIYTGGHVGATVTAVLEPGPEGAESTARFECLVEGVQETEARVSLERKLDGDWAGTEQGRAIQSLLDRRIEETLIIPPAASATRIGEYCGGWQQRSWDLYAAAAAAAGGKVPDADDKNKFFGAAIPGK